MLGTIAPPIFHLFSSLRYDPLLANLFANQDLSTSTSQPPTRCASSSPTTSWSAFYMLAYHRDRILQAAEHFGWDDAAAKVRGPDGLAFLLSHLEKAVDTSSRSPLRVKVLLSFDGVLTVEAGPTPPVSEFNLFPVRLPQPSASIEPLQVSALTGGALTLGDGESIHGDPPTSSAWDVLIDTVRTKPSKYTSYKTTSRDMYSSARENVGIKDFTEKREVLLVSENGGEIMEGSLTTVYFWRGGRWVTPKETDGGQIGTTRRWALEKGLCVEGTIKVTDLIAGEDCWISNGVRGFQCGKIKLH